MKDYKIYLYATTEPLLDELFNTIVAGKDCFELLQVNSTRTEKVSDGTVVRGNIITSLTDMPMTFKTIVLPSEMTLNPKILGKCVGFIKVGSETYYVYGDKLYQK